MTNSDFNKILVINTGSSSLKFMIFDMVHETMLAKGLVERIGTAEASMTYQQAGGDKVKRDIDALNHTRALDAMCKIIVDPAIGVLKSLTEVDAIGHRVVHGGESFSSSIQITDEVKSTIEKCSIMAPLHNPPNIEGIRAAETVFPGVPNVAVFDTAFHQTMPDYVYRYAVPEKFYTDYGVRKYGFHGTSHKFVTQRAAEVLGKAQDDLTIITCHLGNGSSFAAIKHGKVLDTTMGMTPLAGLIMGTRSGDVDPGVVFFLSKQGYSVEDIDKAFNKEGGIFALGGTGSSDMRELCAAAAAGAEKAQMTLKAFAHRAALFIGGYKAILGKVDAIIMTGGIGENSEVGRQVIIDQLTGLGITLDVEKNLSTRFGAEGLISAADSSTPIYVLPTNEELMIARETFTVLTSK